MITYQNPEGRNAKLTVSGPKLTIGSFTARGIKFRTKTFDLTNKQGANKWRLWMDKDGTYSEKQKSHWWLLIEAVIPNKSWETIVVGHDEQGNELVKHVARPLDLEKADFYVYELPEA